MKKIFSFALMLLGGVALMSSCSEDRDSNPTLLQPTEFVLNETNWRGVAVVLENTTDSLILSWSQPKYTTDNAPVVTTYTIDISATGTFKKAYVATADDNTGADYVTLGNPTTDCLKKLGAEEIDRALVQLCGWKSATEVPVNAQKVTFRVNAAVLTAVNEALNPVSNTVSITVLPYYMVLKDADPEIWYLIGSDIADGSWGETIGEKTIPMQTIEDATYDKATGQGKIQWIGYLEGNGFKLRGSLTDNWATQWGQGAAFGTFVKNDGGSGNITVPAPGVYQVVLYTDAAKAADDGENELTITAYTGSAPVFTGMAIAGSFNDWADTGMNPCSASANNHDWYLEQAFSAGDEVKIKQAGSSWDFNRGGKFVEYGEGLYAYGVGNGDNLVVPETATYTILFNDITGFIRFIKKAE